jgi:hypothetical protein
MKASDRYDSIVLVGSLIFWIIFLLSGACYWMLFIPLIGASFLVPLVTTGLLEGPYMARPFLGVGLGIIALVPFWLMQQSANDWAGTVASVILWGALASCVISIPVCMYKTRRNA